MQSEIILNRDVDAIQIPSGDNVNLPAGLAVFITQSLGGSYTVATEAGLARISTDDADALGIEESDEVKAEKNAEQDELENASLEDKVWHQLKKVFDPEIPVDIVNLGLVYDCALDEKEDGLHDVFIQMTLTAPGCGMGPTIAADAQSKVMSLDGIKDAKVDLVWEPAWNQDMISEEGKMQLGMM